MIKNFKKLIKPNSFNIELKIFLPKIKQTLDIVLEPHHKDIRKIKKHQFIVIKHDDDFFIKFSNNEEIYLEITNYSKFALEEYDFSCLEIKNLLVVK